MYSIDGTRRLPEAELPWLAGYENSSPVRTGNQASGQLQLDVWGETLDSLNLAREAGIHTSADAWAIQVALMEHLEGPGKRWEALRDEIRADVLAHGYDSENNTFTQSYESKVLDASQLMIPRVGFLPGTDPRVKGTIAAIQKGLTQDGLVLRYQTAEADDGLPGHEGVFLACSFWLVDALHGAGERKQATALFERLLTLRNDVGLLSEEWDPYAKRQLGNTPQAFSHFALVTSAFQLHSGRAHRSDQPLTKGSGKRPGAGKG
jgi:GH15 family glucan-1,4-alpha-glucosidase